MPTLVIADDSMFQRFQTAKAAREAGFSVIEAKDGRECLEKCLKERPDVLLLDLNMPVLSGLEVMESLAGAGVTPRILVVTADIQETTRGRCLELGAAGFLNKPVEAGELTSRLAALAAGNA